MITIIDYDAGNLTSVKRALDYLGLECVITPDPAVIAKADRVIFPGVGHAGTAVDVLKKRALDQALKDAFARGTPLMGICLGTQIVLTHSDEGDTECLGLVPGNCPKFELKDKSLKIPHMGWNQIKIQKEHYILKDIREDDEVYFVHSYYPKPDDGNMIYATTEYEIRFASAIGYKNLFASQFHPEKSGPVGLQMLKNFSEWDGK